ncbi:MAG TPA: hypothetical protein PLP05_10020, partial [Sedimentisphaerales bacterium]|nr:hypothetical protein [Sedimentisphaerales bacterium]
MKKLSLLAVWFVFVGHVCAADITTGLRAWWKMDGPTNPNNTNLVADSSGNGYNMVKGSDVTWNTGGGLSFWNDYSSGVKFSDETSSISATAANMLSTVSDAMTVSFRINSSWTTANSDRQDIFRAKSSTSTATFAVEFPNSSGQAWLHAGANGDKMIRWNATTATSSEYIPMYGQWATITITKDASAGAINSTTGLPTGEIKLYVNGVLQATTTHTASWDGDHDVNGTLAGMNYFRIGGQDYVWPKFGTTVDNFMIFDRALTDEDAWFLANPADLNCDKLVNMQDLQLLVYAWLDGSGGDNDINKDGTVNFKDYAILLDAWNEGGKYYFNSASGNDNNTGTSPDQAWKSLTKFNNRIFLPGDKIYFTTYGTWTGTLTPKGSGTSANPIVIDAYGDVYEHDVKPRFDGNGTVPVTIEISNVEYWEINNLQVTNLGTEAAGWRRAINISSSGFGQMDHIYFRNMYVHSVNGTNDFGGGAAFEMGSSDPTGQPRVSFVNDVLIENCYIKSIDNCGIHGGGGSATPGEVHGTNHVIRGNYFEDMGGAAVIVIGTDGCIVENNVVNGCMKRYGSCAMWPWGAFNTVFQYNEVYGCDDRGDGESYDSDYHCTGTIFQYNYSHDNPGGFMRICNDNEDEVGNVGTIVRYNISINDGSSSDAIFPTWKRCDDVQIYNNVIYSPTGTVPLVNTSASGGSGAIWHWSNNIFYSNGTLRYDI